MSHLQHFDYPGFGERSKDIFNYSQAVRIDKRIEISGQGGWDRITEEFPESLLGELNQTFDNIEHALQQAGGKGLEQVYKLRFFITVPLDEIAGDLARVMKERFKDHGPLASVIKVMGLYKTSRVEIEAEAHLG
ncbi:hypothetical protein SLS59_009367 [Nothophoma quercina]|uniref:Uncharacterized protein n=1 Tax=Nothophoma quercina TaxID=749835 RepID=A0ABR3QMV4_9PLEO